LTQRLPQNCAISNAARPCAQLSSAALPRLPVADPTLAVDRFRQHAGERNHFAGAAIPLLAAARIANLGIRKSPGIGTLMTAPGFLLGFVFSILGIALHRRLSGRQSVASYPPVIRLRQEGWHYPVYPVY
jgi:hypothetical protein